ncbi:MAG: ABC transporter permease subunit [Oculatellaceae cyanobacterium bins.114]|nr:ABC transporter permease subunit [Oculatellaceae cyanobacterium bins.114]
MTLALKQTPSFWVRYPWVSTALGLAPMAIGLLGFLVLPIVLMVVSSFQTEQGFSFANYAGTIRGEYLRAFLVTMEISLITAILGGVLGTLTAIALAWEPFQSTSFLLTLGSVAANWGGVPLAFAMIATVGNSGWITEVLRAIGLDLYRQGFSVYGNIGLILTYTYFQWPLMLLLMLPAVQRFRQQWREAAESLGATRWQFWQWVGIPILLPSMIGGVALLFANAFGAQATAFALAGGALNLISIKITFLVKGQTDFNPGLANALAVEMTLVLAIAVVIYQITNQRARRWMK